MTTSESSDSPELRRLLRAVAESESRFRVLADTAPVMIWMSDVDGDCEWFNKPWLDFRGRQLDQEIGDGWTEGVHEEDLENCLSTYRESCDAREAFEMEYRLRRDDGEYRWMLDHGVPRFDPDGTFLGYIGTCIDVTDRRRVEEALARSRDVFVRVFRGSPAAMTIVDTDGWVLDVNDRALTMFGYRREEMVGRKVADLELWGDKLERERALESLIVKGSLRNVRVMYRTKTGTTRPCLLSMEDVEMADVENRVVIAMIVEIPG